MAGDHKRFAITGCWASLSIGTIIVRKNATAGIKDSHTNEQFGR